MWDATPIPPCPPDRAQRPGRRSRRTSSSGRPWRHRPSAGCPGSLPVLPCPHLDANELGGRWRPPAGALLLENLDLDEGVVALDAIEVEKSSARLQDRLRFDPRPPDAPPG